MDRWHVLKNLREAIERVLSHTPVPARDGGRGQTPFFLSRNPAPVENESAPPDREHDAWHSISR
jgi:hypothetical protein